MPERIQLSRRKGWRKAENTVVVARPSKWGNPFAIGSEHGMVTPGGGYRVVVISDRATAVDEYRRAVEGSYSTYFPRDFVALVARELAGKNLACWCPLDQPCHADVLLALANSEPPKLESHGEA